MWQMGTIINKVMMKGNVVVECGGGMWWLIGLETFN